MNRICLMLLCSFVLVNTAFAQKSKEAVVVPELPVDAATGLYTYGQVVEVPATSKDELYKRAFAWANGFYKNPGDVIREKNLEEGKILIKARFRISNEPDKKGVVTQAGDVMYSLTFNFKEGKYKYEITKINWQQTSYYPIERWKETSASSFNPAYLYYLKQTDEVIKSIISDFSKKIAEPAKVKSNDW
jgi:glutamine cyclotransferase